MEQMLSGGTRCTSPGDARAPGEREDDFLALLSHELRTPLTSIIGYLELALDEDPGLAPIDPERRAFLEVVDRNAQSLLRLIGDLLFAAELRADGLVLSRELVDLARVARGAASGAAALAEARGVTLAVQAPEEILLPAGDLDRLGLMLDHLVADALRAAPAGERVQLICAADGPMAVRITVRASGVERPVLPAGPVRTIVEAIVDGHRGRVGSGAAAGPEASVWIELPLDATPLSARAPRAPAAAAPAG